jgi:hypothetical protein
MFTSSVYLSENLPQLSVRHVYVYITYIHMHVDVYVGIARGQPEQSYSGEML